MTTTPRLGITQLEEDQALPEAPVNEGVLFLEQGAGYFIVNDKDLATPPGSPTAGDAYIVAAAATGAWAGWEGRIAFYLNTAWVDIVPIEGTLAYVQDENQAYRYNGAAWEIPAVPSGNLAVAADVWAGTSTTKAITPDAMQDAAVPTALTSGATITPDFNAGLNFSLTLAHNATLANPSNAQIGDSGAIVITQDGTGSRTLAYGTNWKFPSGAPVLSTVAGTIDCIVYYVSASGVILCNLTKAYSS
jgi:uncharacterized protein DUF2793